MKSAGDLGPEERSPEERRGHRDECVEDVAEELPEAQRAQETQRPRDLQQLSHEEHERRERHAVICTVNAHRQVEADA